MQTKNDAAHTQIYEQQSMVCLQMSVSLYFFLTTFLTFLPEPWA